MRALLWRDGELEREEERELHTNMYFRDELLLMLEAAGFSDVEVQDGYSGNPATADSTNLMYIARKA